MSLRSTLLSLIMFTAISAPVYAKEPAKVLSYSVESIYVLNADGDEIREVLTSELPAPTTVTDYNADLDLVEIKMNGKAVWLDTMDLELDQKAGVLWSCKDIPVSTIANDSSLTATMGMSKLCR